MNCQNDTNSLSILNAHNRANTTDNNKVTCMMASHPQPPYNFLEVPFNLLFRDPSEQNEAQMQNNEKTTDAVQQQQTNTTPNMAVMVYARRSDMW